MVNLEPVWTSTLPVTKFTRLWSDYLDTPSIYVLEPYLKHDLCNVYLLRSQEAMNRFTSRHRLNRITIYFCRGNIQKEQCLPKIESLSCREMTVHFRPFGGTVFCSFGQIAGFTHTYAVFAELPQGLISIDFSSRPSRQSMTWG